MSGSRIILVKLGGSLITDKSGREAVRASVLARLATELRQVAESFDGGVIVGHGSGSFGHAAATETGWSSPDATPSLEAVARTQDAAARLHRHVVSALLGAGLAPFSVAPSSSMVSAGEYLASFDADPLVEALRRGLQPVLFGDVVLDTENRARIFSTERVFLAASPVLIARGIEIFAAYWLGATEGVLDSTGATIGRIDRTNAREIVQGLSPSASLSTEDRVADVTGGMRHRLESALDLARLGVPSWILDGNVEGRLARAVAGKDVPGTRVDPD